MNRIKNRLKVEVQANCNVGDDNEFNGKFNFYFNSHMCGILFSVYH